MQKSYASRFTWTLALIIALVSFMFKPVTDVQALEIFNRSLTIADGNTGVTTTHTFAFDFMSATNVGSVQFEYCSNDPLYGTPCVPPAGLDVSGAILSSQSGETGFSIDLVNTTNNRLVITRASVPVTPGAAQYVFDNIVNQTNEGAGYVRLGTYATIDGTGARTDQGGLAYSNRDGLAVEAYVPPILVFCVGVSITGTDCGTASGSNVNFGTLTPLLPRTGTTQMAAGTNGGGGYAISVLGTTMTSGNNTINAMSSPSISNPGTEQFGLNLVGNGSPTVGQNPTGPGTATPTANFSNPNLFMYANGATLAESPIPSDMVKFTVSYLVNVTDDQKAGQYSTTLTFVCLASF